jgi:hypothetical protein
VSDRIPGGAFPECAKLEKPVLLRPDGQQSPAFDSRSLALSEMRKAVNEYESRIAALEARPIALPFPASG